MLKMPSIDPPGQERIMLFQVKKGFLLAVLVMASLSSTATAGAATATITGGPTLSGTATTSTLLKLHGRGKTLSCTGGTANGTVAASTSGSIPPGFRVGTLTPAFTGCNIVGGLGITVTCQPAALNVEGNTTSGSTKGSLTSISCHIFVTTQTACRITVSGAIGVTHANTPSTIITDTNHQSLVATGSTNGTGGACATLPSDASARFVNSSNGDLQYNVSPTSLTVNVTGGGTGLITWFEYDRSNRSTISFPPGPTFATIVATFKSDFGSAFGTGHLQSLGVTGSFTAVSSPALNTARTHGQTVTVTVTRTGGSDDGTVTLGTDAGPNREIFLDAQ
jgi:hypothetical protein